MSTPHGLTPHDILALQDGERGVVRVTIVDMSQMRIEGSVRNGVRSNPWDQYDIGFRVARG